MGHAEVPEIPFLTAVVTYLGYGLLILVGHFRDFLDKLTGTREGKVVVKPGYAPLLRDFEDFYTRRLYRRIEDCWNRPISSPPGAHIDILKRAKASNMAPSVVVKPEESSRCLNLGSYNYLGFGDPNMGERFPELNTKPAVIRSLKKYGVSSSSFRADAGTTREHAELEHLVAKFVRKPAAMVFGMGFGTNSTGIMSLVGKGGLIISDALNHSSIVTGARLSGAKIKVFKHNDAVDLERVIRSSILQGQPGTHLPWKKIVVIIEGIYSMEGEMCPLQAIVNVKNKYGAYLYVDEAHSIGAIGKTGRGITDFAGVDPADVDVLMGTFTKSFGSVGGYIAAQPDVIAHLKSVSTGYQLSASISPPACRQIMEALRLIDSPAGSKLIKTLRTNADRFRDRLKEMGAHTLGVSGSPVVPVMLYLPAKIAAFSRECYKRNLAVVVVGFPATKLLEARCRFCISAAHKWEDLEDALKKIEEVCDVIGIKYSQSWC